MLAAVTGAAALTGCGQLINPYTTELQYDAADGVSASVGDLKAVDLLVVTDEKGSSNEMSGLVHNSADADRQLTISVGGTDKKVTVPAGQSIRLDGKANADYDAYRHLVRDELEYRARCVDDAIAALESVPVSKLQPAVRSFEGAAQEVWRRRMQLRASDLVRFGRTYPYWRDQLVDVISSDEACVKTVELLTNPTHAKGARVTRETVTSRRPRSSRPRRSRSP